MSRPWDLIVFGATGFTGTLVANYLKEYAPDDLSWAVAGRSQEKLDALAGRLSVPTVQANIADLESLQRMVASTRVLLTTVGPYSLYGRDVLEACVEAGTHYTDLTGENHFVRDMKAQWDERARETGAIIVPCCGFEAIPTDLGVQAVVNKLPAGPKRVVGMLQSHAQLSGGTLASALDMMGNPRPAKKPRSAGSRPSGPRRPLLKYDRTVRRWTVSFPVIDPAVIARSARALPESYGDAFGYDHRLCIPGIVRGVGMGLGLAAGAGVAKFSAGRKAIQKLRPQGTGPDQATRDASWFRYTFVGHSGDTRVQLRVAGGDPGYSETAKFIAEASLQLAAMAPDEQPTGGFHTPASALGPALLDRLQAQGLTVEWTEDTPAEDGA